MLFTYGSFVIIIVLLLMIFPSHKAKTMRHLITEPQDGFDSNEPTDCDWEEFYAYTRQLEGEQDRRDVFDEDEVGVRLPHDVDLGTPF